MVFKEIGEVTDVWLGDYLRRSMPGVLERCVENKKNRARTLIRLVRLARKLNPPAPVVRQVTWIDNLDAEEITPPRDSM